MATAYSTILKLALPVQGELSGTWGDVVNDNITSMVEEAIAGRAVINTWTTNSHTLTSADGTTSESRCAMLEFTDTGTALTGDATVVCPTQSKIYICKNDAGQKVTIKTSAGTGVAIADGQTMFVFCDGTNVVEAVTSMSSLKLGTASTSIEVTAVLDEDDLVSDSATALATQQSIKAYVDSQVTAQDLDFAGDTGTGAVDLDSQSLTIAGTSNEIETSASGQTLTVGLPDAVTVTTSVTTPTVQVTNVKANDGTAAVSIADTTGQTTITDAVLTTADINAGTIDNTTIGATTASTGAFTTITSSGNTTVSGSLVTDTIAEETATAGVTVDGVLLKDGGATLTGDLTVDTDTLYVDTANDRVGINVAAPSVPLEVDVTGASDVIKFTRDTGTAGALTLDFSGANANFDSEAGGYNFETSSAANALFIKSDGLIGVGTNSPSHPSGGGISIYNATVPRVAFRNSTTGTTSTDGSEIFMSGATMFIQNREDNAISMATNATTRFTLGNSSGSAVFNDGSYDYDFRVESDGNTHMLFVDASANAVAIGSSSTSTASRLRASTSAVSSGNSIVLIDSANDANVAGNHLRISSARGDTTAYNFLTIDNAVGEILNIGGSGSVVFNEIGADRDFRIESDSKTHAFVMDGGQSKVKINTSSTGVNNTKNLVVGDGAADTNTYTTGGWEKTAVILPSASGAGSTAGVVIGGGSYGTSGTENLRLQFANTHGNSGRPVGWNLRSYTNLDANNYNQSLVFEKITRTTSGNPTISPVLHLNAFDTVVNDEGYDRDFRVESDTNTHMLFVDAGNDRLGVGLSSPSATLDVSGDAEFESGKIVIKEVTGADAYSEIRKTNGGSNFAIVSPEALYLLVDSNNDQTDRAVVIGHNAAAPGSATSLAVIGENGTVFNEPGANVDFRVESDTNTHALFVDASANKVGVLTTSTLDASLNVGNDLQLYLGSTVKRKYYGKFISSRGAGDGTYFGYLLLVPYNPGPSAIVGAAMEGKFTAHRGNSGAGNTPATCEVNVSAAYTNTFGWFNRQGSSSYFQKLVRVTYDSTEYVALKFAQTGGGPTNGIYFDGWSIRADDNFLFMARDTEVTGETDYSGVSQWVGLDGKSHIEHGLIVNDRGDDEDFRVESDGNANMLFVNGGSDFVAIGTNGIGSAKNFIVNHNSTMNNDNKFLAQFNDGSNNGVDGGVLISSYSPRLCIADNSSGAKWWDWKVDQTELLLGYGSPTDYFTREVGGILSITPGRFVINEGGQDRDFRVESDGTSNAFIVDAGDNNAYFFTNTLPIMGSTGVAGVSIGNNGAAEMRILNTTTSPNMWMKKQGTVGNAIAFYKDTASVGTIYVNASSVSYNTTSDYRLKENVVDLTGATDRLKQLEPKRFNFIADAGTTVDGFLAHEAQAVVPEAVTGTHNEVDADGNPVYQGIDQSKLVPLLVATIKELEARITALENA